MIFIYNLQLIDVLLFFIVATLLCGVTYYFAVKSRKKYVCPECGEEFTGEYMTTSRCGMCGALLNKIHETEKE